MNLSWLLGGRMQIGIAGSGAVCTAVINDAEVVLITNNIEARRLQEEEVGDVPRILALPWADGEPAVQAQAELAGSGLRRGTAAAALLPAGDAGAGSGAGRSAVQQRGGAGGPAHPSRHDGMGSFRRTVRLRGGERIDPQCAVYTCGRAHCTLSPRAERPVSAKKNDDAVHGSTEKRALCKHYTVC